MACATTGTDATDANGTATNGTESGGTKDDKCANGVSQFVLAPIIAFASLFALLA